MRVWSIPLRTRFRGITVREGVLLEGAAGWGEWSPFLEYDARVAEPWLRCAEEQAAGDWPGPLRTTVPVNVTVPAVAARLREHPDVTAVEVLGFADEEWGQRVVAFVVGRLDRSSARDWVGEEHPRAWAPQDVVLLDVLPELANGKVDRHRLRELR